MESQNEQNDNEIVLLTGPFDSGSSAPLFMESRKRESARERMLRGLSSAIHEELDNPHAYFRSGAQTIAEHEDGFITQIEWLDPRAERPENISLRNANLNYRRSLKVQVTVTEVGEPTPEIATKDFLIGCSEDAEEHAIYIKSLAPRPGWKGLTYAVSERYEKARKGHEDWPVIQGYDISQWSGTLFYVSGPVPIEALVRVHEIFHGVLAS